MVLVVLVVYLFLQTWRATIIPTVAVPVSLIGTFVGLYPSGFRSIRSLYLEWFWRLGLWWTMIVVVENVDGICARIDFAKEAAKRR